MARDSLRKAPLIPSDFP